MTQTQVRIWDKDRNLKFTLDAKPGDCVPDQRKITLPLDHEAAKWLVEGAIEKDFCAVLTVDDGLDRWMGPLHHWKVDRVGSCHKCDHCMEKVLRTYWQDAGFSSQAVPA